MAERIVRVGDAMKESLHVIDGLASVAAAVREMRRLSVSSLVIARRSADDECGILTVQDIAARVVAQNRSAERTSVYEVMTKPALTLPAEMNAKYGIRLLTRLGLTRALVIGEGGQTGLVTLRDLVLAFIGDGAGRPAEASRD